MNSCDVHGTRSSVRQQNVVINQCLVCHVHLRQNWNKLQQQKNILYMTRMFGWLMAWPHRFAWLIAVRLSHCYVAGVTKTISKNTIGKSLKWYQTTINAQCHHGRRLSSTHNTSWCPMPREERQLILRDYMHTKNEERTHRYMCVTHRCMKSPLFINVMRSLISW